MYEITPVCGLEKYKLVLAQVRYVIIVVDGIVICSMQEYDPLYPTNAIEWCARLLPFVQFVTRDDGKENVIENCILSLLLELPDGSYFVNMFAHCFPLEGSSAYERSDKWRSLMQRVRRKIDVYDAGGTSATLSPLEHYRKKSCQRNEQLNDSSFQISPFGRAVYQDTGLNVELTDRALLVGSWEFEYDAIYIGFLDTVLSILAPIEAAGSKLNYSVTSLSKDCPPPKHSPPLLGAYHSQKLRKNSWQQLTVLVEQVHHWAHLPSAVPSLSSELPSMRVDVPFTFLISSLHFFCKPSNSSAYADASECEDVPDYPLKPNCCPVEQATNQHTENFVEPASRLPIVSMQETGYPKQLSIAVSCSKTDDFSHNGSNNKLLEANNSPGPLLQLPVGTLQVIFVVLILCKILL